MASSSRRRRRRSRSGASLSTMPSATHRTMVGATRSAKTRGVIRGLIPNRFTQATAPGMRSSVAWAWRCVAARSGPASRAELFGSQQTGSEDALRLLGHLEDRPGCNSHRESEPRVLVPAPTHHRRDQRHQQLAVPVAEYVIHVPGQLGQQRVRARGVIAPFLPCQIGGELHETCTTSRRSMPAVRQDRYAVRNTRGLHRGLLLRGCDCWLAGSRGLSRLFQRDFQERACGSMLVA